jgi:hypothetical protein
VASAARSLNLLWVKVIQKIVLGNKRCFYTITWLNRNRDVKDKHNAPEVRRTTSKGLVVVGITATSEFTVSYGQNLWMTFLVLLRGVPFF